MKYIFLIPICFLLSCNTKPRIEKPLHDDTPKALQEETSESNISSIKKAYRGSDILEELFEELVEKNPDYKTLLKRIENMYEMRNDSLKEFNSFDQKSKEYYSSANNKTNSIQDTILRAKILKLIENSNTSYNTKTASTQKLIEAVNANENNMSDLLIVLKITSTINHIEKFQNKQAGLKSIKELLKQQEDILKKLNAEIKKNGS